MQAFNLIRQGILRSLDLSMDRQCSIDSLPTVIFRNIGLRGGVSPVRRSIPELLEDVLEGTIHPGLVFDFTTDLNGITEAYVVMDERRAMKSLVQVGTI